MELERETRERAVQNFHTYERRMHPLEMWQALYRKMRFYQIDFCKTLGEQEIGLKIGNDSCLYPASVEGMKEASRDIEHAFAQDLL